MNLEFIKGLAAEAGRGASGDSGLFIGGGSPCNDLAGTNHHRTGIVGKKSVLFFEFARVVNASKDAMMAAKLEAAEKKNKAGTPYKLKCSRPITRKRLVTTLGSYIK
jgi:hypothetical protein